MTTPPSAVEVDRIAALREDAVRNVRITLCYADLSAAFREWLPDGANWCTFAVWASKQAGQSIRGEDFTGTLHRRIEAHPALARALDDLLPLLGSTRQRLAREIAEALSALPAVRRTSDAVARGNRKVFQEIGREFARFLSAFPDTAPPPDSLSEWSAPLRAGAAPDGQDLLRSAFEHYVSARRNMDRKQRAELILLANLEIGLHEQTRLQPEIREAMESALPEGSEVERVIVDLLSRSSGPAGRLRSSIKRAAARSIAAHARDLVRAVITDLLMTLAIPPDRTLRLGEDLQGQPPADLRSVLNVDLRQMLERVEPGHGGTSGSGALDWADLEDRIHFIAEFFHLYQEDDALREPPFSDEQRQILDRSG